MNIDLEMAINTQRKELQMNKRENNIIIIITILL